MLEPICNRPFARKANVIVRAKPCQMPTKDDSFLPYRGNKEFWALP